MALIGMKLYYYSNYTLLKDNLKYFPQTIDERDYPFSTTEGAKSVSNENSTANKSK